MAVDTEAKRWSMLAMASPMRSIVFNPTGSDAETQIERTTILLVYGGNSLEVKATTITVSSITGGASLSSLSYVVFSAADVGDSGTTVIKQGSDETTDVSGDLVIDLTGLGVDIGTTLTIVITNYTTTPALTNRGAVCFSDAA